MKRNILWMRQISLCTLIVLVFSTAIVLVGVSSPIPTVNQTDPTATVYLDPQTINGTAIGVNGTVTVNLMISGASNVYAWQAGLTFNPHLLKCTGLSEGKFLSDVEGPDGTRWIKGIINNMAGTVWSPSGCTLLGDVPGASGSGILANATFKVKAPGVSDIHLSDVEMMNYPDLNLVPVNIIDIYTVVSDTTPHTVVTVSNLTGSGKAVYGCCFYDYAFNSTLKEVSFKVAGPNTITQHSGILDVSGSFSKVTIPKALLPPPEPPHVWAVLINGTALSIEAPTENATHTSIYFAFSPGTNDVQITTRFRSSTISMDLSGTSIRLGESVTISGAIDPVKPNVRVTIYNRTKGTTKWDTLANVTTDQNSKYTYTWEPRKTGTYEVMASWKGDNETLRADSGVKTLEVKGKGGGIPLMVVAIVVVAIIVIAAIIVYFVKIRKPK